MNLTILFAALFTSAHAAEILPQATAVRLGVRWCDQQTGAKFIVY